MMGEGITSAKQKLTKKGHLPVGMDFNFSYHFMKKVLKTG
jgi:hypothetical protein